MFRDKAKEVVSFAMTGPLLQPQFSEPPPNKFGMTVGDLDEAFRLYGMPARKPDEAKGLGLFYLPDDVFAQQGKLTEYSSRASDHSITALVMKERIAIATAFRMGKSNSDLENEVEGALCAILEGRLARGDAIPLFEDMFYAYKCGYWPFAIQQVGDQRLLAVYIGGITLDNAALDLPY